MSKRPIDALIQAGGRLGDDDDDDESESLSEEEEVRPKDFEEYKGRGFFRHNPECGG